MGVQKFFLCEICGNLAGLIHNSGVQMVCCGQPMTELEANTVDASYEKHLPVVKVDNNTVHVSVGSTLHPSTEEHYIAWVYLQTDMGGQRKNIKIGDKPETTFALCEGEKPLAAFAYCNLHGLWKTEIK